MITGGRLRRACSLVFLALLTLAVSGCGGDDGDRGPRGEAGPPLLIGPRTQIPAEIHPKINNVSVASPMVVDFQITDEFGFGVIGIDQGISFTVSKLVPGASGETNNWSTYIRADDEGDAKAQGGTYDNGTLKDNGNGTYTFTFADDLKDISGVSFEPNLTHRVGIELRDAVVLGRSLDGSSNAVHDFQPSTGKTSGITRREIVKQDSCKTCHGPDPFSFHGGPRKDVRYCVTCHQPASFDSRASKGLQPISIDFRQLIHKIHAATADAQYCGFGCENFGSPVDDFSDVHFPQDVRNENCTNCHDPNDAVTPQATNVYERPTAAVCTSCHTELAVTVGANGEPNGLSNINGNHALGGAQPNENCANCHSAGGGGGLSVELAHVIPEQVWAGRFEYNILGIDSVSGGTSGNLDDTDTVFVLFSITDPTNGDAAYDLASDPAFAGSETSVNLDVAWPTSDYTNTDGGTGVTGGRVSRPASVSLVSGNGTTATLGAGVSVGPTAGTYVVDTGITVPAAGLGSGAIVIEGHMSGDFDGDGTYDDSVPVRSEVDYFAINDTTVQPRRTVVDTAKCQNCHGVAQGLAFHGGNRNDNTQVCAVCHNPNQTDLNRRPGEPTATAAVDGSNPNAVDGVEDQSVDFKYMIHAIHGAEERQNDYTAYGFRDRAHTYSHGIPRPVDDCLICHEDGTYELPLGSNVLATTLSAGDSWDTGTDPADGSDDVLILSDGTPPDPDTDPADDHNASATAAVCASCHDSRSTAEHMMFLGNGFMDDPVHYVADAFDSLDPATLVADPDDQAEIDTTLPATGENCVVCHGAGSIADVAEVHGVE